MTKQTYFYFYAKLFKTIRINNVLMFLYNHNGELIILESDKFSNKESFYEKLWKLKYNITIASKKSTVNTLIDFINYEND